jgi:hypothetical protein
MPTVSALGPRPVQTLALAAPTPSGGAAANAHRATASGYSAVRLPVVDAIPRASNTVSLSSQALSARADQLGNATVDVAQQFIRNFATSLFGDKAAGATLTFESAAVSANASFSASAASTSSAAGSVNAASFALTESAHFIGKGQIVTGDGHTFQFEVEVRYDATAQVGSTQATSSPPAVAAPDTLALMGRQLPAIEFPGSLADLFKLLGRDLELAAPHNPGRNDAGENGKLSLRLLRLVNAAALLAPRAPQDSPQPNPADRSKAVASSYGATPVNTGPAAS